MTSGTVTTTGQLGAGGSPPTGSVTFFSNGQSLGSAPLNNGSASLTLTTLPPGNDSITAVYSSDTPPYLNSTSMPVSVPVLSSIFVLNPTASGAVSLSGNSTITTPGLVVADSNSPTALVENGNDNITASGIELVGGDSIGSYSSLSPAPAPPTAPAPDPLAALPIPSATGLPQQGSVSLSSSQTAPTPLPSLP